MNVKTTKTVTINAEEIEQAVAEWLSRDHPGVMQDETEFQFNIRGANLDKAYDRDQLLEGCTVIIRE